MDWRTYSRTGRVYAAVLKEPVVVHTTEGPQEAREGDYLVADSELSRVAVYSADDFSRLFELQDRPVPLRALSELSGIAARAIAAPEDERAGDTCVRCGRQRTLARFEGLPICEECELALRAGREETLSCQHDGAAMRKEIIQNVIVDRCAECGGVWFDGGELEVLGTALRRAADHGLPSELANTLLRDLTLGAGE